MNERGRLASWRDDTMAQLTLQHDETRDAARSFGDALAPIRLWFVGGEHTRTDCAAIRLCRRVVTLTLSIAATTSQVRMVSAQSPSQSAPARTEMTESLDADVRVAPMRARIGGRDVLVYEVFLTNTRSDTLHVRRVRIVDASRANHVFADLADSSLSRSLQPLTRGRAREAVAVMAPGVTRVLHAWVALDSLAAVPQSLAHVIEFTRNLGDSAKSEEFTTRGVSVATNGSSNLSPPLRGGPWLALYDPWLAGGHRMSIYTIGGRARIPARFAIDLVRLDDARRFDPLAKGLQRNGYGDDVLAVASGVVVAAVDDMPDTDDAGPRTRLSVGQASGNHVILSLGDGRFAVYEHLKPRSVRVRAGQRVRVGEVVAQLGASGSSSIGPHLHFHVADSVSVLAAEGVPFRFQSFVERGNFAGIDEALSGREWTPTADAKAQSGVRRRGEMPRANSVVVFP